MNFLCGEIGSIGGWDINSNGSINGDDDDEVNQNIDERVNISYIEMSSVNLRILS